MGYIDLLSYDGFHIIVHIKLQVKLNCPGNCSFGKGAFWEDRLPGSPTLGQRGRKEPTAQGCSLTSICALWHMNAHKKVMEKNCLHEAKQDQQASQEGGWLMPRVPALRRQRQEDHWSTKRFPGHLRMRSEILSPKQNKMHRDKHPWG